MDSASTGGTWDISNADRLGKSEVQLVNIFIEGTAQIIKWEQEGLRLFFKIKHWKKFPIKKGPRRCYKIIVQIGITLLTFFYIKSRKIFNPKRLSRLEKISKNRSPTRLFLPCKHCLLDNVKCLLTMSNRLIFSSSLIRHLKI